MDVEKLYRKIGQSSNFRVDEKGMLIVLIANNTNHKSMSVKELQELLPDKPGTVSRVIKNLERKGAIIREQYREADGTFGYSDWCVNTKIF
jgi:Mn-dependent DtxR family transcriptional regulator